MKQSLLKMKYFIFFSVIVIIAICKASDEDGKIVGGNAVDIKSFPFVAGLINSDYLMCGGAIIERYWILTAAHCITGAIVQNLWVRVGTSDITSFDSQSIKVKQAIPHPKYDAQANDYDIALLQLVQPITYNDVVKAIPVSREEPQPDSKLWVCGWGAQYTGGSTTRYLSAAELKNISRGSCDQAYRGITDRMICATLPGKDSCQGDSGGPLTTSGPNPQLCAVVSFGEKCASAKYPGVYANVAQHEMRTFIQDYAQV